MRKRIGSVPVDILAPPLATIGTSAINFWKHIPIPKRHVFPAVGWLAFDWGFAVRCTGPAGNRNSSGIAAFIRVQADPVRTLVGYPATGLHVAAPLFTPDERYVLVPGDASYGRIPGLLGPSAPILVGIVATHHGGDELNAASGSHTVLQIPSPARLLARTPVIYSYGLADAAAGGQTYCYRARRPRTSGVGHAKYGHPRPAATAAYQAAGWTRRLDTGAPLSVLGPSPSAFGHLFVEYPAPAATRSTNCQALGSCQGNAAMDKCFS